MVHMEILGLQEAELRSGRTGEKWQGHPDDVLPLSVAEMDSRPCPDVVAAVTAAVQRGDTGYHRESGAPGRAFAGFAQREWGWRPDLTGHRVVPDVMLAIREVVLAATPPGSPVVINPPCYNAFHILLDVMGRPAAPAPLTADGRLDPDALVRAFRQAGRGAAYVLCNPQNPTGTIHTADELRLVAELAERHDVLVISDEIHAPLTRHGERCVPYLSLPEAGRGLAVHSASKAFNLGGLRGALLLAGARVRDIPALPRGHVIGAVHHVATIAQQAAWGSDGGWLAQLRRELDQRRARLAGLMADHLPQVRFTAGPATYLAWLDCGALGLDDPARHFLERARVALVAGQHYSGDHQQWVRLNYATSEEVLTEAVRRMADSLP